VDPGTVMPAISNSLFYLRESPISNPPAFLGVGPDIPELSISFDPKSFRTILQPFHVEGHLFQLELKAFQPELLSIGQRNISHA
jgi:hypothetical protein